MRRWQAAIADSLYGPDGFFTRADAGPAAHFRTSAHSSALLAQALARLLRRLDTALGSPARLDVVDLGAGRGELLTGLLAAVEPDLGARVRATAVELAPRPAGLPAAIGWRADLPDRIEGLLLATEWLDNVPLDVVEVDDRGVPRYVLVERDGREALGPAVDPADAAWLATWWPLAGAAPGTRAEIGRPRDEAWRAAVGAVHRGLALAIDYGHTAARRPPAGTLTGYRGGRQVPPVPDGGTDLTAHVAVDAVAAAPPGVPGTLTTQRAALRGLGVDGGRPPLALAATDPTGYVRALAAAGAAAELTDPEGLGGHYWLTHTVGVQRLARPLV